jgi:pentatricopeptide repeat protein
MRSDAGLFPDQVTYNMLIHVLSKHGHADETVEFLKESEGKRFRVDEVGYSAIVHSSFV